jgi:hypothetical protein
MTDTEQRILDFTEHAARDHFEGVALRTKPMTPSLAAAVLRRLPEERSFSPSGIATHVERLAPGGGSVQVGKSASQAFVVAAIPGSPQQAFEWAAELMTATGAASVKMNFGPGKATHVKVFWGKPEVNTLIEIGGDE